MMSKGQEESEATDSLRAAAIINPPHSTNRLTIRKQNHRGDPNEILVPVLLYNPWTETHME